MLSLVCLNYRLGEGEPNNCTLLTVEDIACCTAGALSRTVPAETANTVAAPGKDGLWAPWLQERWFRL